MWEPKKLCTFRLHRTTIEKLDSIVKDEQSRISSAFYRKKVTKTEVLIALIEERCLRIDAAVRKNLEAKTAKEANKKIGGIVKSKKATSERKKVKS